MKGTQTIHKQGYLYKQGTYFSTWNERYFSLETSLLKQFTDADSPIPSYSIYLGTAVVDGVFSAADNSELGHGELYTIAIRYPLPTAPDALEEQWGFMHLGSYEEKEIDEWFDSLSALIRVEQTKRYMASLGDSTPPDVYSASTRRTVTILQPEMAAVVPARFKQPYLRAVEKFNAPAADWNLVSSIGGLLCRHRTNSRSWKFSVAIPRANAGVKRVWESLLGSAAAAWEPAVKRAYAQVTNQDLVITEAAQLLTDTWNMHSEFGSGWVSGQLAASLDRVAFRDDKSGVYIVVGVPASDDSPSNSLVLESVVWIAESVSDQTVVLTCFLGISKVQKSLSSTVLCALAPDVVADAVMRPAVVRIRDFILSQ